MTAFQLAPGVERPDAATLAGGSPYRVMRLAPKGVAALSQLLAASQPPPPESAGGRLAARLVRAGMLVPPLAEPVTPADVTVVIPALSAPEPVRRLLDSIPGGVPVVVVDDGSAEPLAPLAEGRPDVVVIRHAQRCGAAAARNSGAALAETRWIAFVDADVQPPAGWLGALLGVTAEPDVIAVAPRVVTTHAPGLVGLVESRASALDFGPVPADVVAGSAVSFVPTATLIVDRDHFRAVGGFDEAMPVGEDVDLVWRFAGRGRVRYEPRIVVSHQPRPTLWKALSRRRFYGDSVGLLEVRHPGTIRHANVSIRSLAPWLLGVAGRPGLGVAAAGLAIAGAPRELPQLSPGPARRLAARGQMLAITGLGRWMVRPFLPVTAVAVALSHPPLRRRLLLAIAAGYAEVASRAAIQEYRAGASCSQTVRAAAETVLAHALDDVAYSVGVWRSCLRSRAPGPLLPRVRDLPSLQRRR
ncbi:mycofactocin biosynthesis glycosyltransferase MftF [Dactylosporangium sp. NPDC000555]|uniref:mycofactocin biosynthesis glycosyltransferase MftF n=1 Tax=Dactylosporangium sp. NPDC000555 TaxID=3154260 RepID=UPI00332EFC44